MTTKRQKQPTKNATKKPIKLGEKQAPFNTLAQPVNNCFKDAIQVPEKQANQTIIAVEKKQVIEQEKNEPTALFKRAKSKYFTQQITIRLANLDSPLKKQYWNAYHCSSVLTQIDNEKGENKVTARYCGTRCCNICNRIRTAKMMNGYGAELNKLENLYFVTLTIKNIGSTYLRPAIEQMIANFQKINGCLKHKYKDVHGLRKLEITYNPQTNEYHPHFHILVDGSEKAEYFLKRWLELYPNVTNQKGQDIRRATQGSYNELFKYTTKIAVKTGKESIVDIKALDIIFQALQGKRILQPFGKIKKQSEDINDDDTKSMELEEENIKLKAQEQQIPYYDFMKWVYHKSDWINHYGEEATGFVPIKKDDLVFR
jgi:plasmid rolling circle replication initiator protein Rep